MEIERVGFKESVVDAHLRSSLIPSATSARCGS
uniref:Uncharacterized protein n=1 Tax=Arundo donax TaxID=35708 RepID=A0A0A9C1J7_ARUDO